MSREELDTIYSEVDRAKEKLLVLYEAVSMTDDDATLERIEELVGQLWEKWHPEFGASRYAGTKPAT